MDSPDDFRNFWNQSPDDHNKQLTSRMQSPSEDWSNNDIPFDSQTSYNDWKHQPCQDQLNIDTRLANSYNGQDEHVRPFGTTFVSYASPCQSSEYSDFDERSSQSNGTANRVPPTLLTSEYSDPQEYLDSIGCPIRSPSTPPSKGLRLQVSLGAATTDSDTNSELGSPAGAYFFSPSGFNSPPYRQNHQHPTNPAEQHIEASNIDLNSSFLGSADYRQPGRSDARQLHAVDPSHDSDTDMISTPLDSVAHYPPGISADRQLHDVDNLRHSEQLPGHGSPLSPLSEYAVTQTNWSSQPDPRNSPSTIGLISTLPAPFSATSHLVEQEPSYDTFTEQSYSFNHSSLQRLYSNCHQQQVSYDYAGAQYNTAIQCVRPTHASSSSLYIGQVPNHSTLPLTNTSDFSFQQPSARPLCLAAAQLQVRLDIEHPATISSVQQSYRIPDTQATSPPQRAPATSGRFFMPQAHDVPMDANTLAFTSRSFPQLSPDRFNQPSQHWGPVRDADAQPHGAQTSSVSGGLRASVPPAHMNPVRSQVVFISNVHSKRVVFLMPREIQFGLKENAAPLILMFSAMGRRGQLMWFPLSVKLFLEIKAEHNHAKSRNKMIIVPVWNESVGRRDHENVVTILAPKQVDEDVRWTAAQGPDRLRYSTEAFRRGDCSPNDATRSILNAAQLGPRMTVHDPQLHTIISKDCNYALLIHPVETGIPMHQKRNSSKPFFAMYTGNSSSESTFTAPVYVVKLWCRDASEYPDLYLSNRTPADLGWRGRLAEDRPHLRRLWWKKVHLADAHDDESAAAVDVDTHDIVEDNSFDDQPISIVSDESDDECTNDQNTSLGKNEADFSQHTCSAADESNVDSACDKNDYFSAAQPETVDNTRVEADESDEDESDEDDEFAEELRRMKISQSALRNDAPTLAKDA